MGKGRKQRRSRAGENPGKRRGVGFQVCGGVIHGHAVDFEGEVHAILAPERGLAYTTIATMLRKMEGRGFVAHRAEGRSFIYKAAVAAEEVSRDAGNHFVERLFEGSLANAVSHLLQTREVSREELDKIEEMVKEAKRKAKTANRRQ